MTGLSFITARFVIILLDRIVKISSMYNIKYVPGEPEKSWEKRKKKFIASRVHDGFE